MLRPYIAAKLETLPSTFTLGDQKQYNGFYNKPLQSQKVYRCFVMASLKDQESVSTAAPKRTNPRPSAAKFGAETPPDLAFHETELRPKERRMYRTTPSLYQSHFFRRGEK